jgi:hypothetical protein
VLEVLGSLQDKFKWSEPEPAADLDDAVKYLESASATL